MRHDAQRACRESQDQPQRVPPRILDPFSCNYNAAATCDDGSCYACYGCTDPTALNYEASAYYEDGTCFYEMLAPAMGMTIIPDEDTTLYWIMLNVTSPGNGAPYIFQNGDPSYSTIVDAAGQYMTGPYSCLQTYNFNLVSMAAQMTEYMAVTIEESCSVASGISEINSGEISIFPNPANDRIQIMASGKYQLQITDIQGRVIETRSIIGGDIIDVSEFPNGIYLARMSNPGKTETLRFAVRH
ncbi:MAG: T9SS type A sorting domain-containing protein [Flavobacteriales bacterium]